MQIVYQVFKKVPLRIDQNAISSEKFVFFLSDPSSGGNSLSTPFHSLPPIKLSGSDEGDMYKRAFRIQKPAISLKRSSLEPELLNMSIETYVRAIDW